MNTLDDFRRMAYLIKKQTFVNLYKSIGMMNFDFRLQFRKVSTTQQKATRFTRELPLGHDVRDHEKRWRKYRRGRETNRRR